MNEKLQFPILNGGPLKSIPWSIITPHETQAMINHNQTLKRLAERGGLSPSEAVAVLENRGWHGMDRDCAIATINRIITERPASTPADAPKKWKFVPSSDNPLTGSAMPECWVDEDEGDVVFENPNAPTADATGEAGEELAKVTAAAVNLEPDENGPGLFEYDDPQGRYVTAEFAREQARTIATLRAECESKRLEILERIAREAADRVFMDEYQDQRDTAQQALSQAYYLITGKSPQWSDTFGTEQAVQEIDDAQRLLRDECAGLREDVNAMRLGLSERIFFTGDNPNYHRHGYSLEVDSETSYGDVNIKKYDLYPTPDEAIDAFIKRMKEIIAWQASRATEGK